MNSAALQKKVYVCGTLRYSLSGLIGLFFWLLWGDFSFTLMNQLPTLLPLIFERYAVSGVLMGILLGSIPSLINFILNPIISTASDRTRTKLGRRIPYILYASPFLSLFLLLIGWCDEIGGFFHRICGGSPESKSTTILIFLCIFLLGQQIANMFISTIYCYVAADVVPKELMGRFLSIYRMIGTAAGFCFGKFAITYSENHIQWVFTIIALLFLISFLIMSLKVKEGEYPPPERVAGTGKMRYIKVCFQECFASKFFLLFFLVTAIHATSVTCRTLFNLLFATKDLHLTYKECGEVTAWCAVLSFVLYYPCGMLADKVHPIRVYLYIGFLICASNVYSFFFCTDYTTFFISTALLTITYTVQGASSGPLLVRIFPHDKFGQFCAAAAMVGSILLIVANLLAGYFIDSLGYRYLFVWDFALTLLATILMFKVYFMWQGYGGDEHYVPPIAKDAPGEMRIATRRDADIHEYSAELQK